jgi:hypothetical protein
MPPTLRTGIPLVFAALLLAAGCGNSIGDSCALSTDCSPQGDRQCDLSSPGGYCTVIGCAYDTCPEDSICVRFFSSAAVNRTCDSDSDCSPDELCTLGKTCVPRSSEIRYCMKTCGNNGDCRDKYECRNEELMRQHGGEPVAKPGEALPDNLTSFCAPAPPAE